MLIKLFIHGIIIGFLVSLPLGPIGVLVIQRTVNKSRRAGLFSGAGAALSDVIYAMIAGFSLTIVIDFIRQYQMLFQVVGAIAVMGLGLFIYTKNPVKDLRRHRRRGSTHFQDLASTFLLTFSNPLSIFVFLAIFASSGIVLNIDRPYYSAFIILGIFVGAMSWWFSLSGVVSLFRHKINLRLLWWINKVAGILIILFVIVSITVAIHNHLTL
jgi:threonine/homoserine/homoserine lactone efflux protein